MRCAAHNVGCAAINSVIQPSDSHMEKDCPTDGSVIAKVKIARDGDRHREDENDKSVSGHMILPV